MKRLVIDDVRSPNFDATIVRDAVEALELIRNEAWDEVWLDHDMDLATGPAVSWMTDRIEEDAEARGLFHNVDMFILHSANTVGRRKMRAALEPHYNVIELEQYPDKTVSLTGGPVVEVFATGKHKIADRDDSRKWWAENSHIGLVAVDEEK